MSPAQVIEGKAITHGIVRVGVQCGQDLIGIATVDNVGIPGGRRFPLRVTVGNGFVQVKADTIAVGARLRNVVQLAIQIDPAFVTVDEIIVGSGNATIVNLVTLKNHAHFVRVSFQAKNATGNSRHHGKGGVVIVVIRDLNTIGISRGAIGIGSGYSQRGVQTGVQKAQAEGKRSTLEITRGNTRDFSSNINDFTVGHGRQFGRRQGSGDAVLVINGACRRTHTIVGPEHPELVIGIAGVIPVYYTVHVNSFVITHQGNSGTRVIVLILLITNDNLVWKINYRSFSTGRNHQGNHGHHQQG